LSNHPQAGRSAGLRFPSRNGLGVYLWYFLSTIFAVAARNCSEDLDREKVHDDLWLFILRVSRRQRAVVAATLFPLLWWTLHGAVGTEHAAISWLGPQQLVAIGAFMEEAADVRGGFFERGVSAVGAG
jgi:hypothetical protein